MLAVPRNPLVTMVQRRRRVPDTGNDLSAPGSVPSVNAPKRKHAALIGTAAQACSGTADRFPSTKGTGSKVASLCRLHNLPQAPHS
jgi:hypothetical protein